jgi:hypothetical protein
VTDEATPVGVLKRLGVEIELEIAEHAVGGYSLGLIGRDLSNGAVLFAKKPASRY